MKVQYKKPFLDYKSQLRQLIERGLIIEDEKKALHLLEAIGYYRLSGYWYPMLEIPKSNHKFKKASTFNNAFMLYCFDRELRKMVSGELEKIEIAIRAKMIYILSEVYGPFWYNLEDIFSSNERRLKSIEKLREECGRSDEQFILSFKNKYIDTLPPSWMMLEISSFGNLSHIYKNLKPGKCKRDIANHFGLDEKTFESWLHTIVYVRNICAHHSRFWNRIMRIRPQSPRNPSFLWLDNVSYINPITNKTIDLSTRSYFVLSMIIYLLNTINPKHSFRERTYDLLEKYENVDPLAMGAHFEWRNENLWKV